MPPSRYSFLSSENSLVVTRLRRHRNYPIGLDLKTYFTSPMAKLSPYTCATPTGYDPHICPKDREVLGDEGEDINLFFLFDLKVYGQVTRP